VNRIAEADRPQAGGYNISYTALTFIARFRQHERFVADQ